MALFKKNLWIIVFHKWAWTHWKIRVLMVWAGGAVSPLCDRLPWWAFRFNTEIRHFSEHGGQSLSSVCMNMCSMEAWILRYRRQNTAKHVTLRMFPPSLRSNAGKGALDGRVPLHSVLAPLLLLHLLLSPGWESPGEGRAQTSLGSSKSWCGKWQSEWPPGPGNLLVCIRVCWILCFQQNWRRT